MKKLLFIFSLFFSSLSSSQVTTTTTLPSYCNPLAVPTYDSRTGLCNGPVNLCNWWTGCLGAAINGTVPGILSRGAFLDIASTWTAPQTFNLITSGALSTQSTYVGVSALSVGTGVAPVAGDTVTILSNLGLSSGGNLKLRNADNSNIAAIFNNGAAGQSDLQLQTNSINRVTIKNNGNLGIGTTNPLELFHLSSPGANSHWRISDPALKHFYNVESNPRFSLTRDSILEGSGISGLEFGTDGAVVSSGIYHLPDSALKLRGASLRFATNTQPTLDQLRINGQGYYGRLSTQVLVEGSVIQADGCGGQINISSSSAITTDQSITLTAASSANVGCQLNICNVGNFAITLDSNANFIQKNINSDSNITLGLNSCITVIGDGISWKLLPREVGSRIDVRDFGAKCDSVTNDSSAFQAAADHACKYSSTIIIPTSGTWNSVCILQNTVTFKNSATASFCTTKVIGEPNFNAQENIRWTGGDDKAIFRIYNLKNSQFEGLKIGIYSDAVGVGGTPDGVVAFDLHNPAAAQSTSQVTFRDIVCGVFNGPNITGDYNFCVRGGGGSDGNQDVSAIALEHVTMASPVKTDRNILIGMFGPNVTSWYFDNVGASNINKIISTDFTNPLYLGPPSECPGGTCDVAMSTSSDVTFAHLQASEIDTIVEMTGGYGEFLFLGGRWEGVTKIIDSIGGGSSGPLVSLYGVKCAGCQPGADNIAFKLSNCQKLILDNFVYDPESAPTAAFITANCSGAEGSITMRGGAMLCVPDPFYTLAGNHTEISMTSVGRSTSCTGGADTHYPDRRIRMNGPTADVETITSTATITANTCGSIKRITGGVVTTNTTNTFTTPSNANAGCRIDVCNVGANAITLDANANFKTSGTNCLTSGGDVVLGADDCVAVMSDGVVWRQLACISAN